MFSAWSQGKPLGNSDRWTNCRNGFSQMCDPQTCESSKKSTKMGAEAIRSEGSGTTCCAYGGFDSVAITCKSGMATPFTEVIEEPSTTMKQFQSVEGAPQLYILFQRHLKWKWTHSLLVLSIAQTFHFTLFMQLCFPVYPVTGVI